MTSALTLTTFDALTKDYYNNQRVYDLTYHRRPFLAMIPKDTTFGGRQMPLPLTVSNPQGRSKTFSVAKARSTSSTTLPKAFDLTAIQDYSLGTVSNFALESTKKDKHAHAAALKTEMDGAQNALANSLAINLTRSQSGSVGQVNVEPGVAVDTILTMKFESDITTIEVGQVINIWSAESGGTQRIFDTGVTDGTVKAVNRSDGTFTIEEDYTANGTIAADDFIFQKGDRGIAMAGLASWIPFVAPTSASFFGVDRTADTTRLGGIRYDGSSDNIEQACIKLLHRVAREGGGAPDVILMNFDNLQNLILTLGSKVQYINVTVPQVSAGFYGVQILGPSGAVKVFADPFMTDEFAYALTMNTWKLCTIGEAIKLSDTDGNSTLRQSDDDGIEFRYRMYGNLGCLAPGHNGVVKLK